MAKLTVKDLNVRGKRVLVRVDYNVPMEEKDGQMVINDATRIQETGYGLCLPRYTWTDAELVAAIETLLADTAMQDRLRRLSAHMRGADGRTKAARLIDGLVSKRD